MSVVLLDIQICCSLKQASILIVVPNFLPLGQSTFKIAITQSTMALSDFAKT